MSNKSTSILLMALGILCVTAEVLTTANVGGIGVNLITASVIIAAIESKP